MICSNRKKSGRGFVLLAPPHGDAGQFAQAQGDPSRHEHLLGDAQRLRGRIYVQDGAIGKEELTRDGRHIQPADALSWHLLTVDQHERVTACIRYLAHRPGVLFSELVISRSNLAQSPDLGPLVREAIQEEIDYARRRGFSYVELGGWAISEDLRCTTEAVRTLLSVFALSQVLGGARALSTATTRHHSSSILRRVGGEPLKARGSQVPTYYDPHYKCEMELLSFDSTSPSTRYAGWIRDCREALSEVPVISSQPVETAPLLLQLHTAISQYADPPTRVDRSLVAARA